MSWIYNNEIFEEVDPKYFGFVYIITNKLNNKQYIGKKQFTFKKTKQVKGKPKKISIESDWKSYFGSNEELKEHVKEFGPENFEREILKMCKSKGECSYWESKYQFQYDVLLYPEKFYNGWISCKIRRSHLLTKALLSEKNEL